MAGSLIVQSGMCDHKVGEDCRSDWKDARQILMKPNILEDTEQEWITRACHFLQVTWLPWTSCSCVCQCFLYYNSVSRTLYNRPAEPLVITVTDAPGESSYLNSLSHVLSSSLEHCYFSRHHFSSQIKLFKTSEPDLRTPDGFIN